MDAVEILIGPSPWSCENGRTRAAHSSHRRPRRPHPEVRAILQPDEIARVLEEFRDGRPSALETVQGWIRAVLHGGRWRFGDPEAVAQEVLLKLLRIVGAGRIDDPRTFQKFVYSVTKNTCVTQYHRERRRATREQPDPGVEPPAPDADPGRDLERRDRLEAAAYVLQRISGRCRQLWDYVYVQGQPAEQIAETLGISVGNLRVRVHRCLARAREIYGEYAVGAGAGGVLTP